MSFKPLVSIIGTTGVGKSRLAIEIALALSGHGREHGWEGAKVLNADSMQVYAGADVITNKVPESQRRGVEHLLMGFKEPGEQYVVGNWVNDAIRIADDLHREKKLPIAVGGTSYWMQHLIFPNRLTSFDGRTEGAGNLTTFAPSLQKSISSLPGPLLELFLNLPERPEPEQAFALYELLTKLDPRMAARWHWNESRKVLRNLKIIKEKGVPASEVMDQQAQHVEEPRYRTLILWLFSHPGILRPRLDARVDDMMQQGLLDDVRLLRRIASANASSADGHSFHIDTTCGIFQSIGFKEFDSYLSAEAPSQELYDSCVERTKVSTRQYAKRQVQWIQNKLLPAANLSKKSGSKVLVYLLNVTDLQKWDEEVRDLAVNLVHDFLTNKELPDPLMLSETAASYLDVQHDLQNPATVLSVRRKVICEVCTVDRQQPFMVEDGPELLAHNRSRRHRRRHRERMRQMDRRNLAEQSPAAAGDPLQGLPSLAGSILDD